jgi:malonate transporter
MTQTVFLKLLVLIAVIGAGWYAGHTSAMKGPEPVKAISAIAFYMLMPALLFRSTATVDLQHLPWHALTGYYGPVLLWLFVVYGYNRIRLKHLDPAQPATRAMMATFGNTLQLGLPFVAALYGDAGLSIHVAIISLHALTLLTAATVLAEWDLSRTATPGTSRSILSALTPLLRNTFIHPVILPVLAGLSWNLAGLAMPQPMDEALQILASGVVPICLVLIGLSLAHYGVKGYFRVALAFALGKMVVQPAMVLALAHWGLGISGTTLSVLVLVAALPNGSNALLFAQRYQTQIPQASATIVVSTVLFALIAPLWLQLLSQFS